MARGGSRRGGGAGRGGRGGRGKRGPGAEKYGEDPADVALKLVDDEASEAGGSEDEFAADDVLAFESGDEGDEGEDDGPPEEAARPAGKARAAAGPEQAKKALAPTAGWKGADFYGGDDGGDDSDEASDEGLVLEEARKLEELRAQRLAGADDPLASLLAPAPGEERSTGGDGAAPAAAAPAGSSATARFESVFAAETEHASAGPRDLEQLPEGRRRGLLKREAPELPPLLEDFQAKLKELRELLPLLAPGELARLPPTGVGYVRSKAALLLSTLANLSFYVLLRAEGGAVRTHPVVPQLVWLRELHQQLAPLDQRLAKQLQRALRSAGRAAPAPSTSDGAAAAAAAARAEAPAPEEPERRRRPTIRERVEQLRAAAAPAAEAPAAPRSSGKAVRARSLPAADLLRLPGRRGRAGAAAAGGDGAEDLDEVDPVLGIRMPSTTFGEQISEVQQLIRERGAREKVASADTDVMPRKSARRERSRPEEVAAPAGFPEKDQAFGADLEDDGAEDELVKRARGSARAKKERRLAGQLAEEKERIARQDHPEDVVEGRRSTSKRILQNRGLIRQRKKQAGNARVANRVKFEKAVKRRKGAVQEMRQGAADGATYAGEETGIRTHLKKSQRLA